MFRRVESGELPELLRLWVNDECLVRGRVKSAKYGWYNESLASAKGIPVFERSTGGGVVYNDLGNLNWSFFLRSSGNYLAPRSVFESVSRRVIECLSRQGFPAYFSPPNRIDLLNRKISGMAARATLKTLLVHGTLLIQSDVDKLNELCVPPPGCPPVANLTEWKPHVRVDEVITSFAGVLSESSSVQSGSVP